MKIILTTLLSVLLCLLFSCENQKHKESIQIDNDLKDFDSYLVFKRKKLINEMNKAEKLAFEIGYIRFVELFLSNQLNQEIDAEVSEFAEINYSGLQYNYLKEITNKDNYNILRIDYELLQKYGLKLYLITWNTFTENILIAIDRESNYFTLFGFEINQSETLINYTLNNNKSENRKRDSIILHNLFNYNARSLL